MGRQRNSRKEGGLEWKEEEKKLLSRFVPERRLVNGKRKHSLGSDFFCFFLPEYSGSTKSNLVLPFGVSPAESSESDLSSTRALYALLALEGLPTLFVTLFVVVVEGRKERRKTAVKKKKGGEPLWLFKVLVHGRNLS